MTPVLEIADLVVEARRAKDRHARTVVNSVSLKVMPGETVALIGESGAGKTTVALSALGYTRPGTRIVSGRVSLDGVDVLRLDDKGRAALRGSKVAYIAQSAQAALNPVITLGEQVSEPAIIHGTADRSTAREQAISLMEALKLPDPRTLADRLPYQASGGQLQRAMIAMAMSCNPQLMVLDEPTTALDVTTQIEVLRLIKHIVAQKRVAALYVSHDLAFVAQVADRVIVMKDGEVVEAQATEPLLTSPAHPYSRSLLSAVRTVPETLERSEELETGAQPLIELAGIDATYARSGFFRRPDPSRRVLRDAALSVYPGEVMAVVGESGSGKSTLARVVAGLQPIIAGTLRFKGEPLPLLARHRPQDLRRRIQIIFQSPDLSLNPERKIGDILGRVVDLYFKPTRAERDKAVAGHLESVGLPAAYAGRYPGMISGGERQRVSIARALAAKPDVIICDEVLSSLDTVVASSVLELMRDLRRKLKLAYLFISHDLSTVAQIADRVAVLYAGQVVESGPVDAVFGPSRHPYTDLLLTSIPQLKVDWLETHLQRRSAAPAVAGAGAGSGSRLCSFLMRCPVASRGVCDVRPAPWQDCDGGHRLACHHPKAQLAQHLSAARQSGDALVQPSARAGMT